MKKRILTFIFSLVFILPLSLLLFACGGSGEKKINGITAHYTGWVQIEYGQEFTYDPFQIELLYSDGSSVMLEDLAEEDYGDLSVKLQKEKTHIPEPGETYWQTEWEDWDYTTGMPVGSYKLIIKAGTRANTEVSFAIVPTTYPDVVTVSLSDYTMVYGGEWAQPSVSIDPTLIQDIEYRYQEKTDDGSYRDTYTTYMAEWSAEYCDITPGEYQLYANIETENYGTVKSALTNFTVNKAEKTNYALFVVEYNGGNSEYVPFNGTAQLDYDYNCETISDYLDRVQVEICEVDGEGNILYDEYERPVFASSISNCLSLYDFLTLTSEDVDVDSTGTYHVTFDFTTDSYYYAATEIEFNVNIVTHKSDLPSCQGIKTGEAAVAASVEYDGEEHRIDISDNNYYFDNGVYYGVETASYTRIPERIEIDDETNHGTFVTIIEEHEEWSYEHAQMETVYYKKQLVKIYTITNFKNTNAGEYTVTCTLLPEWNGLIQLYKDFQVANQINIGTYSIRPKSFNIQANIMLDGQDIDNYRSRSSYDTYFVYDRTYTVTANNIEAYLWVGDGSKEIHGEVTGRIKGLYVSGEYTAADGVIINGNTIKFTKEFKDEYAYVCVIFTFDDSNYADATYQIQALLREAVKLVTINQNIYEYADDLYTLYYYQISSNSELGSNRAYVSADETTYTLWNACYSNLYIKVGENDYSKNTSNDIDFYREYYQLSNDEYQRVLFYILTVQGNVQLESPRNGNIVYYNGHNKNLGYYNSDTQLVLDVDVQKFSEVYADLYLRQDDSYSKNSNDTINWNRTYYQKIGSRYVELYFYYKVGSGYVHTYGEVEGITEYYVARGYMYIEAHLGRDIVSIADIYDQLYTYVDDEQTQERTWIKNDSPVIDFTKSYFLKDNNDYYYYQYIYYKVGELFYPTEEAVDGVTDYYIVTDLYSSISGSLRYTRNYCIEKFDEDLQEWVKAENTKDVGRYRKYFEVNNWAEYLLVDNDGNYVFDVAYEWEVRKTGLTAVSTTSGINVRFTNSDGNELTPAENNSVFIDCDDRPLTMSVSCTLSNPSVRYKILIKTATGNGGFDISENSSVTRSDEGSYHSIIYIVLEDGYYLVDSNGNAIEYTVVDWELVTNE